MLSYTIIENKTLKQYYKKYRHTSYRLLSYSKEEVRLFDIRNNSSEKQFLLYGRKWWLIDDTYYEIPSKSLLNLFRNLSVGAKLATCVLLGGIIATGIAIPTYMVLNTKSVDASLEGDAAKLVKILKIEFDNDGNKLITLQAIDQYKTISKVSVKINQYDLTSSDYSFYYSNGKPQILKIFKATLDAHNGKAIINPTVTDAAISSIDVTRLPNKINYHAGEQLNLDGLEVTANYENGEKKVVTNECSTNPSKGSKLTQGTNKVDVTHDISHKNTHFNITVGEKVVTAISVTSSLTKTTQYVGDNLDLTGLKVKATYSDGSSVDDYNNYTTNPGQASPLTTAGNLEVVITSSDVTTVNTSTFITVENVILDHIDLNTERVKKNYTVGDKLDLTNLVVNGVFNDTSKNRPLTSEEYFTTPSITKALEKTDTIVTVSATIGGVTKTNTYTIVVSDVPVESITLSEYTKELRHTDSFNLTATINPENAGVKQVSWTVDSEGILNYPSSSASKESITVKVENPCRTSQIVNLTATAGNKSAKCSITVLPNDVMTVSCDRNIERNNYDPTEKHYLIATDSNGNKLTDVSYKLQSTSKEIIIVDDPTAPYFYVDDTCYGADITVKIKATKKYFDDAIIEIQKASFSKLDETALQQGKAKMKDTTISGDVILPNRYFYNNAWVDITDVDSEGFKACNAENIIISDNIKRINSNAFIDNTKLKYVQFVSGSYWTLLNGTRKTLDVSQDTINATNLKNGGTWVIGLEVYWFDLTMNEAKDGCVIKYNNVGILSNDVVIPKEEYLTGKEALLPVKEIDADAFRETNITSVKIPSSITKIGTASFLKCDSLISIDCSEYSTDNIPVITDSTFNPLESLPTNFKIYVKDDTMSAKFKTAPNWSVYADYIFVKA